MGETTLRLELRASFANRAMVYASFWRVLRREFGEERAAELMKQAIRERGEQIGQQFREHAPADLEGLCNSFLAIIPDGGRMFEPEIMEQDGERLTIQFHRCPLKEAWLDAGLSEEETAQLCAIVASVDFGTFEGAGFKFSAETWEPGKPGCCRLHIEPGAAK